MDELLDNLSGSLRVTLDESSTATPHPRFASYKAKYSASAQVERRRTFFENQKKNRSDLFQHARRIAIGVDDPNSKSDDEQMDCTTKPPRKSAPRTYKNKLMLSEWLVDVPEDFAENWLVVPCPVAKRCLVVSSKGSTKSYARNGFHIATFSSPLPGGKKNADGKYSDFCLLDCVFSEVHRVYYVLDIMCWKSHPLFDSEAEFRLYWKDEKLSEVLPPAQEFPEGSRRCRFVTLPHHPCTPEAIHTLMNSPLPFKDELDGLLFYHKRAHYYEGVSPLVGWLKPYMVPDMLGITVSPHYLEMQPPEQKTPLKDRLETNRDRTREKVKAAQSRDQTDEADPSASNSSGENGEMESAAVMETL